MYRADAANLCQREPRASDGLDQMIVPPGCEPLLLDIRADAGVGDALAMLLTADISSQASGNEEKIREILGGLLVEPQVRGSCSLADRMLIRVFPGESMTGSGWDDWSGSGSRRRISEL